jgi:hypothetical protein
LARYARAEKDEVAIAIHHVIKHSLIAISGKDALADEAPHVLG